MRGHLRTRAADRNGPSLRWPVPVSSFDAVPPGGISQRSATKSPILNSSSGRHSAVNTGALSFSPSR